MSEPELRGLVEWTVADEPSSRRAGRLLGGLLHVVSAVVTLGADAAAGAPRPTWDLPADDDGYLDLGPLELRLPATARAEQVRATRRDVWTTPAGRPPTRVPVAQFRVVEAVAQGDPGRHAAAVWRLTVTDGARTGTLTGAWLSLAWIGHLAGWPEPGRPVG